MDRGDFHLTVIFVEEGQSRVVKTLQRPIANSLIEAARYTKNGSNRTASSNRSMNIRSKGLNTFKEAMAIDRFRLASTTWT